METQSKEQIKIWECPCCGTIHSETKIKIRKVKQIKIYQIVDFGETDLTKKANLRRRNKSES